MQASNRFSQQAGWSGQRWRGTPASACGALWAASAALATEVPGVHTSLLRSRKGRSSIIWICMDACTGNLADTEPSNSRASGRELTASFEALPYAVIWLAGKQIIQQRCQYSRAASGQGPDRCED